MRNPSTFFISFLSFLISHLLTTPPLIYADDPLFIFCRPGENYNSDELYGPSLKALIGNLIFTTPKTENLFFEDYHVGAENQTIFGLAQCRPDKSPAICADCLERAAALAMNDKCRLKKSASVRNEYCVLRYEDHYFSSSLESQNYTNVYLEERAKKEAEYSQQLVDLLEELLLEAMKSVVRIAARVKNSDMNGDIYALAWCTMDLSSDACQQCLSLGLIGYEKTGWTTSPAGGSICTGCILTYDNRALFNISMFQALSSSSPALNGTGSSRRSQREKIIITVSVSASILSAIIAISIFLICRRRLIIRKSSKLAVEENIRTTESLLLPFVRLKAATSGFSNENKLGEGRFGPVYKGVLWDGRQIVVKRLTKTDGQGLVELRNEAALVAQLQHKNLVKLLGCCLQENEKLLVYEYLPNASLDKHLYDPAWRAQLDWKRRHIIIEGIARGLVYLHNHSRLRIIHRDLNAKNILLDGDMNPKISDFSLAKPVSINESQWNTKLIAGTFGYMAPEYAMRGLFSTKSDVFSYGMVVLEIITGRRNASFIEGGNALNLQTYVWQQWNEGKSEEVIDRELGGLYQVEDVLRCINIGLLCIQADPAERPSMASVVLMLSTDAEMLPAPTMPGYFTGEKPSSMSPESCISVGTNYDFHSTDPFTANSELPASMEAR